MDGSEFRNRVVIVTGYPEGAGRAGGAGKTIATILPSGKVSSRSILPRHSSSTVSIIGISVAVAVAVGSGVADGVTTIVRVWAAAVSGFMLTVSAPVHALTMSASKESANNALPNTLPASLRNKDLDRG